MAGKTNLWGRETVLPHVGDTVVDRETGEKWTVKRDEWDHENVSWVYTLVSKSDPSRTIERMDGVFATFDDEPADWYVEGDDGKEVV